jgi:hypothetical protein
LFEFEHAFRLRRRTRENAAKWPRAADWSSLGFVDTGLGGVGESVLALDHCRGFVAYR